jgi:hypothetical protein
MAIIAFYVFLLASWLIWYRNRRKVRFGTLYDKSGQVYAYALGNYLASEVATFNGIDITLPSPMTNFYLDSHKDNRRRGPGLLFDSKQKLNLEGDFDKYFQLFVPEKGQVLALSILSPDVMQTLISSSQRYDVELYGTHLRLISLQKVYDNAEIQADLLRAAQAVLNEVSQRQKSWEDRSPRPARLKYRPGQTFKFGSRYVRRSRLFLSVGLVLAAIVIGGFSLSGYYTYQDPHFSDPYSKGFVEGTLMYAAAAIFIAAIPIALLGSIVWLAVYRSTPDSWFKKPKP